MANHRKAISHLRSVDPVLATTIDRVGPCRLEARRTGTHYDALVRSIVFQQLSGKAAATIHRRLCELYPRKNPRAELLLTTGDDALRRTVPSEDRISARPGDAGNRPLVAPRAPWPPPGRRDHRTSGAGEGYR